MVAKKAAKPVKQVATKARTSQKDFPRVSLQDALRVPQAIYDHFAGRPANSPSIAMALDISPTSSAWRVLTGASVGYGLTDGAYNSAQIGPTAIAKKFCQPTEEGAERGALAEALLTPTISRAFFERYHRQKFPRDDIGRNVLIELGIPTEDAEEALEIIKKNGQFAGAIQSTKTGLFVSLDEIGKSNASDSSSRGEEDNDIELGNEGGLAVDSTSQVTKQLEPSVVLQAQKMASRDVFISHGSNTAIVDQLKQILRFGKWEPVVAVESNTVSKPVPEKVMDDMRRCGAAIIHVASEGRAMTEDGKDRQLLNENVLIEIGAALALYKRNFVLLVEDGTKLPSNLQGLYEVRYTGSRLDYEATMKLLETFNDFKIE